MDPQLLQLISQLLGVDPQMLMQFVQQSSAQQPGLDMNSVLQAIGNQGPPAMPQTPGLPTSPVPPDKAPKGKLQ